MGHTRVIYTDSTTAECAVVLKVFNFEEDNRNGCYTAPENQSLQVYLLWGRTEYYPDFHRKLRFLPRVQIHLKTDDKTDRLDYLTHETAVALKNLDPNSHIQIFNTDTNSEIDI